MYTNDHPQDQQTSSVIYADDLCITCQDDCFDRAEENLSNALEQLNEYYKINDLKANLSKIQVCAFHLKNMYANKKLNIPWNGEQLQYYAYPVCLGVTHDRSLTFKEHVDKTRATVSTRNNILRKLATSKWAATPYVLRTSALARSCSAAEYACPVWEQLADAKRLDPVPNESYRLIIGCLKPANADNLHLLVGTAPSEIRRKAASKLEPSRQACDPSLVSFNY